MGFTGTLVRLLCPLLLFPLAQAQGPSAAAALSISPVIVVGFLGGFVRRDDAIHSTVQIASRLRQDFPHGVSISTFANRQGAEARDHILQLLDADGDGKLSDDEKKSARVIIYGHSWGASQTVTLAKQLDEEGVPVLLTVQVDSVNKRGQNDSLIPSNVAEAVNFYQPHGIIHGRSEIRAADPARTSILGNYEFTYAPGAVQCYEYPLLSRIFMRAHIAIECDPKVWNRVEDLIRSKLPAPMKIHLAANSPTAH